MVEAVRIFLQGDGTDMVELIGIIGSAFICVAFLFKNVIWIRLFDSVGAILFITYGLMIHSFSTVLLNGI